MKNALVFVGIGAIILVGGWWYLAQLNDETIAVIEKAEEQPQTENQPAANPKSQGAAIGDENLVTFKCDGGKTITAVFERDIVGLTLSDGRQVTLREARSGSGIRYLSNDQKIEFSGKGNEGALVENGTMTYVNCLASN
ncbi:MAG: MliC family protein [Patescibacteria group bacterium]